MFEGFERRTVDVGERIAIACVTAGQGAPVLLLHGYPQTHAMWARIAPKIAAAGRRVVCADLRGYGDSSKPRRQPDNSNYSFRALGRDQLNLMRALGHERFHVIGHDRGGRTAHRLALDHPEVVRSVAVLDIVPTYTMFMETNREVAGAYWHWYFLSQPEPLPERMISADPDFFYEACLTGLGVTKLADYDPDQLAEYRRAWRNPDMIHGSCSDYRAAGRPRAQGRGPDARLLRRERMDGEAVRHSGRMAQARRERAASLAGGRALLPGPRPGEDGGDPDRVPARGGLRREWVRSKLGQSVRSRTGVGRQTPLSAPSLYLTSA